MRQAEVEELRPRGRQHDVGGLEIAVDDAERVRGGQCVGDLDGDPQRFRRRATCRVRRRVASVSPSSSSMTRNGTSTPLTLRRRRGRAAYRCAGESTSRRPGLRARIARDCAGRSRDLGRQHLDRDEAIEPRIAGAIDLAHPAACRRARGARRRRAGIRDEVRHDGRVSRRGYGGAGATLEEPLGVIVRGEQRGDFAAQRFVAAALGSTKAARSCDGTIERVLEQRTDPRPVAGRSCDAASQLAIQPGAGQRPVAVHGGRRQVEHDRRFLHREPREEPQLDKPALTGIEDGQLVERRCRARARRTSADPRRRMSCQRHRAAAPRLAAPGARA